MADTAGTASAKAAPIRVSSRFDSRAAGAVHQELQHALLEPRQRDRTVAARHRAGAPALEPRPDEALAVKRQAQRHRFTDHPIVNRVYAVICLRR